MNPVPELSPYLKQLRLSGILDSLEARNRQAIEAKLAYTEFLALLIQDEVARREQKKFALAFAARRFAPPRPSSSSTSSACPTSTARSCTIWPPAVTWASVPRCSSSAPVAPARAIWRRRSVTAPCVRASMSSSALAPPSPQV